MKFSFRRFGTLPRLALGAALLALPLALPAADAGTVEIQHMIQFVRDSGCTFIRNGTDHTPAAAADHIAMKAGYAGGRVKDGDTLIDVVASKSSMTGQPYYVQCPGQAKLESGRWLHTELDHFRRATNPTVVAH